MKHTTQTAFGRPVTAVQMKSEELMVDKWDALKALTDAAAAFDVTHRTLGVLKALMTFLPQRMIAPQPRSAIVFPSNRTLSDRLNGMPDSTLRRHLAKLVELGIVSRHDSANRKRFARRNGQGGQIAFGFDLSPLAVQIAYLRQTAERAGRAHEALMSMRAEVARLRQLVIETPLGDEARQVLRRKPEAGALTDMITRLEEAVATQMSTTDDQNERHIEYEYIISSDSEADVTQNVVHKKRNHSEDETADSALLKVLSVCTEYKSYYPEPVTHWTDVIGIADRLTVMMGIDPPVFKDAMAQMGTKHAAIVVLCMLERMGEIHNPGGYLRRLTQTARSGAFSVRPLLDAIVNRRLLSTDNCLKC